MQIYVFDTQSDAVNFLSATALPPGVKGQILHLPAIGVWDGRTSTGNAPAAPTPALNGLDVWVVSF